MFVTDFKGSDINELKSKSLEFIVKCAAYILNQDLVESRFENFVDRIRPDGAVNGLIKDGTELGLQIFYRDLEMTAHHVVKKMGEIANF